MSLNDEQTEEIAVTDPSDKLDEESIEEEVLPKPSEPEFTCLESTLSGPLVNVSNAIMLESSLPNTALPLLTFEVTDTTMEKEVEEKKEFLSIEQQCATGVGTSSTQ